MENTEKQQSATKTKCKYKYIGKDYWFLKNGDTIEAIPTTWSVPIPDSLNRTTIHCIDFEGVGFLGATVSISLDEFIKQ